MNFLSRLWGGIKSAVSSVGRALTGNNTASAGMAFPLFPGTTIQGGKVVQNQTPAPNMSTPNGPAYADPNGTISVLNNKGQVTSQSSPNPNGGYSTAVIPTSAYPSPVSYPEVRSSTYTPEFSAPVDQFGRQSNSSVGEPYFDAKGNWIVPQQGFSGFSGAGGGEFSTPAFTGSNGAQGSNPNQLIRTMTATDSQGANPVTSDEEKRKKAAAEGGSVSLSGGTNSPVTASALRSINATQTTKQFLPPEVPNTIDAGYLATVKSSLDKLASSGSALSANDRQQVIDTISQNLIAAKTKLDQQVAVPANPVVDTQDQLAFMNNAQDPFGVKQLIDQYKAEQTNLGQLEGNRIELMKNIQALNDAYRPILKDIKDNPDLPKALARLRIEDLAKSQKETLQGFLDQLDIVKQEISDQNENVNRAFNIMSFASSQQNQAQDNMRANLQLMISSGAIGGFDDTELKQYAQALGVPLLGLTKARDAALKPKVDLVTNEFADGTLRGIDKNTGKVLWSIPGAAKAGGNGSDGTATNRAVVDLYGGLVQQGIDSGLDAFSAVQAVNRYISDKGLPNLSSTDLSALKSYAGSLHSKKSTTGNSGSSVLPAFSLNNNSILGNNPISSFLFGSPMGSTAQSTSPFKF